MPTTNLLNRALGQRNPEPFGRYELLGRLATGGMAEVFVARCGEIAGLQTLFALKRILPSYANDKRFVTLFQREARILLRLNHPGIARVVEVGKVDGSWFVAMELVQGETLAHVTQRLRARGQRWDFATLTFIGARVAEALHHAHTLKDSAGTSLGIVHRDVSPQNVMLGFDGCVKVIDFGIARWEMPNPDSRASGLRGKMQYIAPEQARAETLDGRADVFSLAAVMYEAATGTNLFDRGSTAKTLEAVCTGPVPPMKDLPPKLAAALSRALEKKPDARFAHAAAFKEALDAALSEIRRVDADDIAGLCADLFPERRLRWVQIQEMAAAGQGLLHDLRSALQLHDDDDDCHASFEAPNETPTEVNGRKREPVRTPTIPMGVQPRSDWDLMPTPVSDRPSQVVADGDWDHGPTLSESPPVLDDDWLPPVLVEEPAAARPPSTKAVAMDRPISRPQEALSRSPSQRARALEDWDFARVRPSPPPLMEDPPPLPPPGRPHSSALGARRKPVSGAGWAALQEHGIGLWQANRRPLAVIFASAAALLLAFFLGSASMRLLRESAAELPGEGIRAGRGDRPSLVQLPGAGRISTQVPLGQAPPARVGAEERQVSKPARRAKDKAPRKRAVVRKPGARASR